ncbi:MAG TPA: BlaI/MecI/CopY family transcriptional regulator [Planctomycetota bacterium]|nr:BlaI/MecI/CopY family transcriptional regulator [Planctomycetota bacterium]
MTTRDSKLTATQLAILQAVWALGAECATVAAIWERIGRDVARTTVLTQVQRLVKKGWLRRRGADGTATYAAACSRQLAEQRLARRFVTEFFAGSAAGLVKSLLGDRRIDRAELLRLQQLIADAQQGRGR